MSQRMWHLAPSPMFGGFVVMITGIAISTIGVSLVLVSEQHFDSHRKKFLILSQMILHDKVGVAMSFILNKRFFSDYVGHVWS